MKTKVKNYWMILVVILVFVLGGYLLRDVDISVITLLTWPIVIILVSLTLVHTLMYAIAVKLLLESLRIKRSFKHVYHVINAAGTASFISNVKLGVPLRILLYHKVLKIPVATGTASMTLETALWILMMGLVLLIPANKVSFMDRLPLAIGALAGVVGIMGAILVFPEFRQNNINTGFVKKSLEKVSSFVLEFKRAIRYADKFALLIVVCLFATNYFIDAISLRLMLENFGFSSSLFDLMRFSIISYLVGLFSLLPLGLGAKDVSLSLLLTQAGVSRDVAALSALIMRSLRIVIPLTLGILSANVLGLQLFKGDLDTRTSEGFDD